MGFRNSHVQAALGLVLAGPAALSAVAWERAGGAANRLVAPVVEGMVGKIVLVDVTPQVTPYQNELVTREELRRRLWAEDTFVDFEHSISSAINKVRTALNDSAKHPRYIETVGRQGYRFIYPVTPVFAPVIANAAPTASTTAPPRQAKWMRFWMALLGWGAVRR